MDAEVFFYALACPRMALANTFLCGQRLAKKAFDCGVEDWVLCAIQGKREGWAARERWRVLQEQTSAAEWGLLGQATAGRPRRTRSAAWFLSAPASGSHRLRLPAGHQPFRIDPRPKGPCKAIWPIYSVRLPFKFSILRNITPHGSSFLLCNCHVSKRRSELVMWGKCTSLLPYMEPAPSYKDSTAAAPTCDQF